MATPTHRRLGETYVNSAHDIKDIPRATLHALLGIAHLLQSIDDRLAAPPRPVVAHVENPRDWPGDDGS